jgi:hypothetical protein
MSAQITMKPFVQVDKIPEGMFSTEEINEFNTQFASAPPFFVKYNPDDQESIDSAMAEVRKTLTYFEKRGLGILGVKLNMPESLFPCLRNPAEKSESAPKTDA